MPLVLPTQQFHNLPQLPTPPNYNSSSSSGGAGWRKQQSDTITPSVNAGGWADSLRDSLPTPPTDMTGVSYNTAVSSSNYGVKSHNVYNPSYPSTTSHHHLNNSKVNALTQAMMPLTTQHNSNLNLNVNTNTSLSVPKQASQREMSDQKKMNGSIASYLQIPSSINDSKGNLAEFAAHITCLFWFEKSSKVDAIEAAAGANVSVPSLVAEAIPSMGFRKWVNSLLSTTQVSQNVILLALLFIYRLKKFNPGVRGKTGSEFRLMTIALMMGNKFLDDNTYTNKTWAEVSSISVQEIHVMEVEFLSNLRYNLFASKEDWRKWHTKLSVFSDYIRRASQMPLENGYDERTPITPTLQISPNMFTLSPNTQLHPSSPSTKLPSPPFTTTFEPSEFSNSQFTPTTYPWPPFNGPPQNVESLPSNRKRSWDTNAEEHPPKKMTRYTSPTPIRVNGTNTYPTQVPNLGTTSVPPLQLPAVAPQAQAPRLPVPHYTGTSNPMVPTTNASSGQLPPPGTTIPTSYAQSGTWPLQIPASASAPPITVNTNVYHNTIPLPEPSRRQSPLRVSSTAVSPALSTYSSSTRTPQNRLSPSFFLTDRYSPYRPVRSVNTLLIPPPSGSMQNPRSLSFNQMHYQPLGKAVSERRTGVLPYLHHEAWPQQQHQQQPQHAQLQSQPQQMNGSQQSIGHAGFIN
ncbi:hypothetical protein FQN54_006612 [Arachnomyces sp. PD_36]|nr:hypothetical protein FQN54_006612 [Arachnomyces sp. PD_36]